MLTAERVRALLDYDPETGILRWRARLVEDFRDNRRWTADQLCRSWNTRFAGQIAGRVDQDDGYVRIGIDGRRYKAQRIIWLWWHGKWPGGEVDHGDHDRSNNRIGNLTDATRLQNQRNQTLYHTNTSGQVGVMWHRSSKKWMAVVNVRGRRIHLGSFRNIEDAIAARRAGEKRFGFHPNHGREPS